ncbi:MAG: sugar phosphate nucleotidyltransferase [bacterium]|nr:sugar phosphate nucleotidyltransferase [bacterium]
MNKRYVVIMAGGTGTRLWPLSRKQLPKQFLKIFDDQSLLQKTVANVERLIPKEDIFIMANAERTEMAQKQLPDHPLANFLVEPEARDNGPAIALASAMLNHRSPGCTMAILWSDHLVRKPEKFSSVLQAAFDTVDEHPEYLISIGIKPTRPAIEFGYIRVGHEFNTNTTEPVYTVDQFVEKPDLKTAEQYVSDWKYLWNTGYKVYRAQHMLNLFAKHQPVFYATLQQLAAAIGTANETSSVKLHFGNLERRDIERLITEKEDKILVIPADLGWSDIGAWNTVHEVLAEQNGHHLVIKGNHIGINDENCLVFGSNKLIATVGLKNIIIVETEDAILVAHKDAAQDVKAITDQLKEQGKHLYL